HSKQNGTDPFPCSRGWVKGTVFFISNVQNIIDVVDVQAEGEDDEDGIQGGIPSKTSDGLYPDHREHDQIDDGDEEQDGPPPGSLDDLHQNYGIINGNCSFPGFPACLLV